MSLPEKVKSHGWTPFQHEGGSLILHRISLDDKGKRVEHQLTLKLV